MVDIEDNLFNRDSTLEQCFNLAKSHIQPKELILGDTFNKARWDNKDQTGPVLRNNTKIHMFPIHKILKQAIL